MQGTCNLCRIYSLVWKHYYFMVERNCILGAGGLIMKVLWLCNIMLPMIAEHFHKEASNKEGWLSGLVDVVLSRKQENGIELAIAFPAPQELLQENGQNAVFRAEISSRGQTFAAYGFLEDTVHPEHYDIGLEGRMEQVLQDFQPDLVHCFGTEYPHTLAMCRAFPEKSRLLVGIQGLCAVYANTYFADLPEKVVHSVTFRDWLKRDSIVKQQEKFAKRGEQEIAAIKLAGNVTGRTAWDRHYTREWNPKARYYPMNETLRAHFYEGEWKRENCTPHSIFLSQGDYPIKGLHYMLLALPGIRKVYPDVKVYVAGNSIVKYDTWKDKLKLSAYGKYLRSLMKQEKLWEQVVFLGRLNSQEMKARYLKSHLFVCCSTIENSPNSLGEAMLLGMPCVSANVGGIASIFQDGEDGILYDGYYTEENSFDNKCYFEKISISCLQNNAKALEKAVLEIWSDEVKMNEFCKNARKHAKKTHDGERNYQKMTEIYAAIIGRNK